MTRRVVDGFFFHAPQPLPRGRHDRSREDVAVAQRERLMMATTELMAERGYAAVRIGDVTTRAGVSRASFYGCFTDLEDCAFQAYDRFIDVLLAQVTAALDPSLSMPDYVKAALNAYLHPIHHDPVVGRAFIIEIDAVGKSARQRRRVALELFADVIHGHHRLSAQTDRTLRLLPPRAYLAIIFAVRDLACEALERDEPDLLVLIPDLTEWIMQSLQG